MTTDKKDYLMKRRRYGWGWTPVKWQGWLLIGMQLAIIFVAITFLPTKSVQPTPTELLAFFAIVVFAIATIILISFINSPAPAWRWGKKPGDNPDEDF